MAQDKVNESLIPSLESSSLLEGSNDADNEIDTSLVTANADGSTVERVEYIQSIIGLLTGAAADTASTATLVQLLRQIAEAVNNGTGTAIASNKSIVDYLGDASTSSLVARLGALADVAADTASTATIIALLRQIAEAVNNGTGASIGSNLSLVDLLGAFDGAADTEGDIFLALGIADVASAAAKASVVALIRQILADIAVIDGVAGDLTDAAADTATTATMMALLRQIAEAVNNGTGTALGSNLSLVDILGAFDGGADPQGDIFQALGVDTTNSVKALIDAVQDVIGNLTDVADETASTATVMNMLRALLDNRAGPRVVYKTVAFAGGVGTGAVGTVALFTVTGAVKVQIEATCTESLAEAAPGSATICLGYTGTTNAFITATNALDLDAGDLWFDSTPTETIKDTATAQLAKTSIGNGTDILAEIATADINDGTIVFRCEWEPLLPSGAGLVVAA